MILLLLTLACTGTITDTGTDTDIVGDQAAGATLFSACAGCHGTDGIGGDDIGGTPSADLTAKVPALTDTELANIIESGFGSAMPSQYTDAQDVADVVAYLRATFP
jgi:mono/diheme cytochrome c family protein